MKKLIKFVKQIVGFVVIILLSLQNIQAQESTKISELFLMDAAPDYESAPFPYDFTSSDIKDFFNPENSGKYPSTNLFDGYFKTCWLVGQSKTDKQSTLYIKIPTNIALENIILNIFSGYGKSEQLYYQNSRPKKIKLSLFSAFYPEGFSTEVGNLYIIKEIPLDKNIELSDTFGLQSFPLNLDKKVLLDFQEKASVACKSFSGESYNRFSEVVTPKIFMPSFILKVEVIESYSGTKYDDICISELFFNDRFITSYPDRYNEIKDVYIENDNTLLLDYESRKAVVIYKDTSSVFTMVDWPENSNWAILHFVPNDEAGEGSRMEEYYSLIDLKQGKIVDAEFEKCTGISLMFQSIEKEESGRVYINYDGEYKIELK
ncbi:MAG: hypothetical protein DRI74_04895 [Bacteroidetes bacterium]|nr:MAG: hypothetical protein DRI74_04895 [Bacteroidota bacterium]